MPAAPEKPCSGRLTEEENTEFAPHIVAYKEMLRMKLEEQIEDAEDAEQAAIEVR